MKRGQGTLIVRTAVHCGSDVNGGRLFVGPAPDEPLDPPREARRIYDLLALVLPAMTFAELEKLVASGESPQG